MSLRVQFLVPVLVLLASVAIGIFAGSLVGGLIVGGVLAIVLALLLARYAIRRLSDLTAMPTRRTRLSTPLLEATGSFDQIDHAHSVLARWLAAERNTIERERGQTNRQIRMLDRLADGVMLVGDGGSVTYANVAAANLLGGRNPVGSSFIAAARDHLANEAVFECLDEGTEARMNIEVPGEERVVEAILARVSRDPREVVVVMRDITELARLQTLRRDFVANVSHELRTPLSTVKILTETILDIGSQDDQQLRFLKKIDAEVDSMSELVEDLLQLTQLESGRTPLNRQTVAASDLISEVLERMMPIADRHQITLSASGCHADMLLNVDDRRVKQALINLVSNALAHTSRGGYVTLGCEQDGGGVTFLVVDNGAGIPKDDLDRIWERFYKVDPSRSHPGTGLGLAIVKHVAQAHGGSVAVSSDVGKGSTFSIQFPGQSEAGQMTGDV